MPCKIINNSGLEISGFQDMIQSLVSFSQNRFGFGKPPSIFLDSDSDNASNPLGKTAYYDPTQMAVHVYTDDRHPKDIMRSISHELVHHNQNCQGNLEGNYYSGEGYAQKDPHMRKMEKEAYLQGNMCFRDWEDGYKQKQQVYNEWRTNKMSLKEWKNKELFGLLSEKWGFGKNTITEAKDDDPNRPIDSLKRYLKSRGVSDEKIAKMSDKEIDKKAAMLRLRGGEDDVALSEDKEITHMCALKVTHKESGQVGHPIKHTLTESGEISHYTVEFDQVIVENIAVENLDIMVQEAHSHKRDDEKPHDKEKPVVSEEELEEKKAKPDFIDLDGDGDKEESMKKAAADKKAGEKGKDDKDEKEKLDEELEDTVQENNQQDDLRESIYARFRKLIK